MLGNDYSPVSRSVKEAGPDRDKRLHLPLSDLGHEMSDSPLRDLMRRFAVQGFSLVADDTFRNAAWLGRVRVVGPDPLNFIFLDHAPRDSFCSDADIADLCGTRVRDFPNTLHAVGLAREYFHCAHFREPRLDLIDQRISGWDRNYIRLLVPMVNPETDSVEYLFSAVRRIQPSVQLDL